MQRWRTRHDIRGICFQQENPFTAVRIPQLFGNVTGDGFNPFNLLSSLFGGGGASFGPVNQTTDYVPTVNQNPSQHGVQNLNIDFSQIGGPGGNASAQSAGGGLFSFGGAKATGGPGGSNIANFDPTINQVYAPPNYSMPLAGLLSSLGQGNEPFPALMDTPTTPNTFRPPMPTNMPIQGGVGMNVPAAMPNLGMSAMMGGNVAPNSAVAPLIGQQASPVSQGSPLSQMMPPIAPQGAINTAQAMPPLAPNVTQGAQTFPLLPALSLGMQQGGAEDQSIQSDMQDLSGQKLPGTLPAPTALRAQAGTLETSPQEQQPKVSPSFNAQNKLRDNAMRAHSIVEDTKDKNDKVLQQMQDQLAEKQPVLHALARNLQHLDEMKQELADQLSAQQPANKPSKWNTALKLAGRLAAGAAAAADPYAYSVQQYGKGLRAANARAAMAHSLDAAKLLEKSIDDEQSHLEKMYQDVVKPIVTDALTQVERNTQQANMALDGIGKETTGINDAASLDIDMKKFQLSQNEFDFKKIVDKNLMATRSQNAAAHQSIAATDAQRLADEEAANYYPSMARSKAAYADVVNAPFKMGADGELHSPYGVPTKEANEAIADYRIRLKQMVQQGLISNDAGKASYEWYVKGKH